MLNVLSLNMVVWDICIPVLLVFMSRTYDYRHRDNVKCFTMCITLNRGYYMSVIE